MRSPDSIRVLLQVRRQREELEELRLAAILEKLRLAQAERERLSAELKDITTARLSEIQCIFLNTYHQGVEAHSRALWQRFADQAKEIERLKGAQAQQMASYLLAHREREVVENLNQRREDALKADRQRHEQKLNDDLFLSRRVAKWDI